MIMPSSNSRSPLFCKENIFKCVLSVCLPWIYLYACYGPAYSLMWFVPAVLIISLIYIIPFFVNTNKIKMTDVVSIKSFIVSDAIFSLLPSEICCVFTAIILDVFFDGFKHVWFFTSILMCVFLFATLYFWLRYYVSNGIAKRIKSKRNK